MAVAASSSLAAAQRLFSPERVNVGMANRRPGAVARCACHAISTPPTATSTGRSRRSAGRAQRQPAWTVSRSNTKPSFSIQRAVLGPDRLGAQASGFESVDGDHRPRS
jgi:hypothetical protein